MVQVDIFWTYALGASFAASAGHALVYDPRGALSRLWSVGDLATEFDLILDRSDDRRIIAGDVVVASGPLGDHGATIMAARHGLDTGDLHSDCAPVNGLVEALFDADENDPGGSLQRGIETMLEAAEAAIRAGLAKTFLPGRLEIVQSSPTVVLDGADGIHVAGNTRSPDLPTSRLAEHSARRDLLT